MGIVLDNLSIAYGQTQVLRGVTASVRTGGFVLCTGPSGGGKSTLARALMGALPDHARSTGNARIDQPVAGIWQDPSASLSPMRRIGDQIRDVAGAWSESPDAEGLLSQVGLAGRYRAYAHELSAGQLQRAAVARALAMNPRALVADEATSSLDAATEQEILTLVETLRRDKKITVLWITHRPQPALSLATDHWRMDDGQLTIGGTPAISTASQAAEGPTNPDGLLHATNVCKSYGSSVLRDVTLTLAAGETITLRGASGSGKSTLGRILAGLEEPDSGHVDRRSSVAFVWADPVAAINPRWRVDDAIAEPLQVGGRSREACRSVARHWLDRVRLPAHYARRRVAELSGGERRRVGIARGLIADPRCVVFDEATNGLDAALRDEIVELLHGLQRESGAAYLWITHDVDGAAPWTGPSYRMEKGRLQLVR